MTNRLVASGVLLFAKAGSAIKYGVESKYVGFYLIAAEGFGVQIRFAPALRNGGTVEETPIRAGRVQSTEPACLIGMTTYNLLSAN